MRVLLINSVCGMGSTGKICTDLAEELTKRGHMVRIAYGRGIAPSQYEQYAVKIGTELDVRMHGCYARLFDASGFGSKAATQKLVQWIKHFDPDVIHLHNLHGYYLNVEILFDYLRTSGKRIIWTLHDCWAFTGHCCYFDYAGCNKWTEQCCDCPQKKDYPASLLLDRSRENYEKKKRIFCGIPNLQLVTPSEWLAELVRQSYLKGSSVLTLPNWVDTSAFKYTPSDIRNRLGIKTKHMILGVASVWDRRKGLDVFIKLGALLDNSYQIVLVGMSSEQKSKLLPNIIGITRTSDKHELAELYSAADVFVNPTYEDNYPATNLEAIACGTPVVSFDSGGSGEGAHIYGVTTPTGNINALIDAIEDVVNKRIEMKKPDAEAMNKTAIKKYVQLIENGANDREESAVYNEFAGSL